VPCSHPRPHPAASRSLSLALPALRLVINPRRKLVLPILVKAEPRPLAPLVHPHGAHEPRPRLGRGEQVLEVGGKVEAPARRALARELEAEEVLVGPGVDERLDFGGPGVEGVEGGGGRDGDGDGGREGECRGEEEGGGEMHFGGLGVWF
jgi:hypothetical protein